MASSFVPNLAALAELPRSAEFERGLKETADAVLEQAKAVWEAQGPHPYETGAYVSSLFVVVENGEAFVVAGAPESVYLELGTSDTPAFHTLVQALEQAGLKVGRA